MVPELSDVSGDVLAQPTRARLFRRLASHRGSVATKELAAELGLHPSGVRVHLERLRAAGLVSRELISQTRGRPRYGWQVAPDTQLVTELPASYRLLARWLARSISPGPDRLQEVESSGRMAGRELAQHQGRTAPSESVARILTSLGFAPQHRRDGAGQVTFTLGSCPYLDAVRENRDVVCALHRGLTLGLLDALAPSAKLSQFAPNDPELGGCVIRAEGLDPVRAA